MTTALDPVIFDIHGVLVDHAVAGEPARLVRALRRGGRHLAFVTNSSTLGPASAVELLAGRGIAARAEEIASAGMAMAAYLSRHGGGRPGLFIGQDAFRQLLQCMAPTAVRWVEDADAELVVAGRAVQPDPAVLDRARAAGRNGASLVVTSRDLAFPLNGGRVEGPGATVRRIAESFSRDPIVVGKPTTSVMSDVLGWNLAGVRAGVVIGDSGIDTAFGRSLGCRTVRLLSDGGALSPGEPDPDHLVSSFDRIAEILGVP